MREMGYEWEFATIVSPVTSCQSPAIGGRKLEEGRVVKRFGVGGWKRMERRGCLRWTGKMVERSRIEWGSIAFSSFSFRISVKYQKRAMDLIKVACQNEEVGF